MFGWSLHGWENAMVGFLIVAGLFALLAGAATWAVVRLQRIELAESQSAFARYKIDAAKDVASVRSDAEAKIAVAREEAKTAVERAQVDIANANKAIEQARAEAAQAVADTAKANERTAELKLALEKEIAARQPRQISPLQRAQIIEYLKNEPKGRVLVVSKMWDEEAEQFAKSLVAVLKDAGYDAEENTGEAVLSFGAPGQWILVKDPTWLSTPTYAGSIQAAFREKLGIHFDAHPRTQDVPAGIPDWPVLILVGRKPF